MDTVSWALELKDKVTPAGKAVQKSLDSVGGKAKKLASKGVAAAGKGFDSLREKVNKAGPDVLKSVAKWAAAGAVGLVAVGAKMTYDAIRFKDSTLIATRALLKSNDLAGNAYKRMLDFAHYFGEDPAEAMGRFNAALASGFSARDAEKLMQAFGDLRLVTPNVNPDALVGAFGTIRSKAKLELADFQAAVSAGGLNLTLAYEAIGKKIGKNAKQTEALIGSGRVRADVGLVGLLDAINQRTNSKQVGDRLAEYANTASGLVDRLKGLPQQFMLRMTADDSPIKGTLSNLLKQLDPDGPNGKRIMGALNTAFTNIGKVLAEWATPEGIEKITKTIGQVIESAPKIISALGKIGGTIITVVDAFVSLSDNARFLWAEFKRGEPVMIAIGALMFPFAAPFILAYGAIRKLADFLPGAMSGMWSALKDFSAKALKWGGDIVDGLWNGIKSGWKGMIEKVKGLADLLPDAVKKVLGIASPSKVFAVEVGRHIPSGIAAGAIAAAPAANEAIVDAIDGGRKMASQSVAGAVTTSSTAISKSSKQIMVNVGGISVEGTKDGRGVARNIAREIAAEFERASFA